MLSFPLKKNAYRKCVLHINVFVLAVVFRSELPPKTAADRLKYKQPAEEEAERQN